jgi:thiamine pyrophosphokinase
MEMGKKIIIVAGGRLGDPLFFRKWVDTMGDALIVCCDGGARHLQNAGFQPNVILGDMDSVDPAQMASYESLDVQIKQYPVKKDFTDSELALEYALTLNPESIYLWGGLGGRIDHSLANIYLLQKAMTAAAKMYLIDEYCEVFMVNQDAILNNASGQTISLVPLSLQVEGITLKGFLYPLTDAVLRMGETRGVSNMINEERAVISVRAGCLLVVHYWRKNIFPEAI